MRKITKREVQVNNVKPTRPKAEKLEDRRLYGNRGNDFLKGPGLQKPGGTSEVTIGHVGNGQWEN